MKLAIVQCQSLPGNVSVNAEAHRHWIKTASKAGADLLVFPELSLSAYEPELAKEIALEQNDVYWKQWQVLSDKFGIAFALVV